MLHVAHAAEHDHRRIQIRTVDTDVVVLAVMVAQALPCVDELWIAFGTGKNYRYIPAHEIAASIGPQKARALPVFHAMTGCDTVSAFVGHGKKSAWATWNSFPELTDFLVTLTITPVNIQDDTMHCIERFVVLLYDRTSPYTDVNEARKKLRQEELRPAHPTYLRCFGTACEEISLPGWLCLGAGLGPSTRASITNKLGLAGNRGWVLRTALDHTP
jgi:hypothetical protein